MKDELREKGYGNDDVRTNEQHKVLRRSGYKSNTIRLRTSNTSWKLLETKLGKSRSQLSRNWQNEITSQLSAGVNVTPPKRLKASFKRM